VYARLAALQFAAWVACIGLRAAAARRFTIAGAMDQMQTLVSRGIRFPL